jgi:mono/diheme cytochrome c family protein
MNGKSMIAPGRDARLPLITLVLLASLGSACHRGASSASGNTPSLNAYGEEPDWNTPDHVIPLSYQEAQGKRIFYRDCVWCHADSTPAGPSNRSNVKPTPALMNDGATLNALSDEALRNIIALGGAAVGKSPMMPPWDHTLTAEDVQAVIAFARAIAQPPYRRPATVGADESRHATGLTARASVLERCCSGSRLLTRTAVHRLLNTRRCNRPDGNWLRQLCGRVEAATHIDDRDHGRRDASVLEEAHRTEGRTERVGEVISEAQ